jgi:hypothetical protein
MDSDNDLRNSDNGLIPVFYSIRISAAYSSSPSGKARHARVGVAQTWVEDGLYGDACVLGASLFCNYRRHALKRQRTLANVCRLF